MNHIKNKIQTQLHCGACMTDFNSITELNEHINSCIAAKVLLPFIHKCWFGEDKGGHPLGSLINLIHENTHLIKRYAYTISNELNSIERAKIHHRLCKELNLEYKLFKPFESEEIKKIPTVKESEEIIYIALFEELKKRS